LPTLTISGGYTQYSEPFISNTRINLNNIQTSNGILSLPSQNVQFSTLQQGSGKAQAMVSIPVFTSGRISHNIDASKANYHSAQANEGETIENIKMKIAEAYIEVLRTESALQIYQSHVDSLSAHTQNVINHYKQGMATGNENLSASIDESNARLDLTRAIHQFENARAFYNQILARKPDEPVKLTQITVIMPKIGIDELTKTALIQRHELEELNQQIEIFTHQSESVDAENLPQLTINGGYVYQENRYQVNQGMWIVNADLQWKLFDASISHRSSSINAQALSLKAKYKDVIGQITLQVKKTWLETMETQQRIDLSRRTLDQAEENKRIIYEHYLQGLSTTADVIKAEELLTVSKSNLFNAQCDHNLAIIKLRRVAGLL
jgi:outer membrane protein